MTSNPELWKNDPTPPVDLTDRPAEPTVDDSISRLLDDLPHDLGVLLHRLTGPTSLTPDQRQTLLSDLQRFSSTLSYWIDQI